MTFATYKIRTNQVSKRTSDVLSDYELSSSPDAPRASAHRTLAPSAATAVPNITVSSPARSPVFVQANLDPLRPIGALGPAPVSFAPPPHGASVQARVVRGYEVGSSPPLQSVSPAALMSPMRGGDGLQRRADQSWGEGAGAGTAAKGLMELMSGRR